VFAGNESEMAQPQHTPQSAHLSAPCDAAAKSAPS
jgi:hypothetical protein